MNKRTFIPCSCTFLSYNRHSRRESTMKYSAPLSSLIAQWCLLLLLSSSGGAFAQLFPLENPCLQTCANDDITDTILQKCVDKCFALGYCCGNRLVDDPNTSANMLSCANGCEIAYYRSTVEECKADCAVGNQAECEYTHPNIGKTFTKCYECNCMQWPAQDECERGCEEAANFPEFYQYVETPPGTCNQDDIPRFLFGGQSNMVRLKKARNKTQCSRGNQFNRRKKDCFTQSLLF